MILHQAYVPILLLLLFLVVGLNLFKENVLTW